jgi:hypothetical protein
MTTKEERKRHVETMKVNFALDGGAPDPAHLALLECYIEGSATFQDLYDHAKEYVLMHQQREQLVAEKERFSQEYTHMTEEYATSAKMYEEEQLRKALECRSITEEQRRRYNAIDVARANVELSGFSISDRAWKDSLRFANCELTYEEYVELQKLRIKAPG